MSYRNFARFHSWPLATRDLISKIHFDDSKMVTRIKRVQSRFIMIIADDCSALLNVIKIFAASCSRETFEFCKNIISQKQLNGPKKKYTERKFY